MDRDEYIFHRNQAVPDSDHRYRIYRHVAMRLSERFQIPTREFNLAIWQELSFRCATRELELIHRGENASFFAGPYMRDRVIWVYARDRRCIVTAMRPDEVENKLTTKAQQQAMDRRLEAMRKQYG